MANETEKFLKAEQAAEELVEVLKKFRDEAVSYQTSANQLDAVREKLVTFIDASQRISQDTKAAVELLKSIGGPEILGLLHQLGGKVGDVGTDLKSTSKSLNDNFLKLDSKVAGVGTDLKSISKSLTDNFSELDSKVVGVNEEVKNNAKMIAGNLSGLDVNIRAARDELAGKVGDVGTDVKNTSKSLTDNFSELDSKVVGVSDDAKNTAKMMTETLSGLDANIWAVRDEVKSSIELITNSISTEFKATTQRMDRLKKFVFVAIGVSTLALVVGVTILVK